MNVFLAASLIDRARFVGTEEARITRKIRVGGSYEGRTRIERFTWQIKYFVKTIEVFVVFFSLSHTLLVYCYQ
jgi:hypothetical protein